MQRNSDTFSDLNRDSYSHSNSYSYADGNRYSDGNGNRDCNGNSAASIANSDGNSNSDINAHTNGNINPMYGEVFTDPEACSNFGGATHSPSAPHTAADAYRFAVMGYESR